jgi:DNA-binding transcriptional ArsR family regulator
LSRQLYLSRLIGMVAHAKILDSTEQLLAITHPTRLRVLDALRTPDSAAGVARTLGETRQRINHHVKELEKAGLIVSAGERRNGNFVEQLFESVAGTFVLSPRLTWGDGERVRALTDQLSLQHLIEFGERLQRDAAALLDRAAFDAEEIPSAAVEATVHFADAAARAAFLDEYLELTAELIERHASAAGPGFAVGLVVHPTTEETR